MSNSSTSLVAVKGAPYRVHRYNSFALELPAVWREFISKHALTFDQTLPWFLEFERQLVSSDERLEIVAVEDCEGTPIAIVPLRVGPISIVGQLKVNGASALSNYYTAYFAPIVLPGHESEGAPVLAQMLARSIKGSYSAVDLNPVADSGLVVDMASLWSAEGFVVQRYFRFGNWYLDVGARSSQDYFATLPGRVKSTLKRKGAKLRARPDARVVIVTEPGDVAEAMQAYEQVYQSSWKIPEPHTNFIRAIASLFAANGWLRLGIVWVGTKPVAAQIWFVYRGTASIFKLAYDEEFAELSAGSILTMTLMQHVIDVDRVTTVDYLCGDDEYKKDWMSERRERVGVRVFRRMSLPGLADIAADIVKRLRRA